MTPRHALTEALAKVCERKGLTLFQRQTFFRFRRLKRVRD
jgi:hypothetical protein